MANVRNLSCNGEVMLLLYRLCSDSREVKKSWVVTLVYVRDNPRRGVHVSKNNARRWGQELLDAKRRGVCLREVRGEGIIQGLPRLYHGHLHH